MNRIKKSRLLYYALLVSACITAACIDTVKKNPVSFGSRIVCRIDAIRCTGCGECVKACPRSAITETPLDNKWVCIIDPHICNGCGDCADRCADEAINKVEFKEHD